LQQTHPAEEFRPLPVGSADPAPTWWCVMPPPSATLNSS